jgi:hypothetical protein
VDVAVGCRGEYGEYDIKGLHFPPDIEGTHSIHQRYNPQDFRS